MKPHRISLATLSVLSLLATPLLGQPATPPVTVPTTGPAAMFEQAMDRLVALQDGTEYLDDVQHTPLDGGVAAYLNSRSEVIDLLRRGSQMTSDEDCCEVPTDIDAALRSLNAARACSSLLVLQSRLDLQNQKPADAVSDYIAGLALSQYIGQRKLLVARLVECGMESLTVNTIATSLPKLPRGQVESLRDSMKKLPPSLPFSQTLAAERDYGLATAKTQGNPLTGNLAAFYEGLLKPSDGTPAEYHAAMETQKKKFQFDQMIKILAPSLERAQEPIATTRARRAMLETAVDVVLIGPDAVKKSKDPFGDGAFKYETAKDGFVLTSALVVKGKPVTLGVGASGE